ncbi:MAG: hypothetical protein ABIG95_03755 [Candidatus Woesearchaeota archaeon]
MKSYAIVARNPDSLINIKSQFTDFEYAEKSPDFVVSIGGDGTYLLAEQIYPGVPKLIIKTKSACQSCSQGDYYHLVSPLLRKEFSVENHCKLKADLSHARMVCTNDFAIRNKFPTHAIRFNIFVNGQQLGKMLIGDGIVVATPFGSTAYYHSITRKSFQTGIGIAFNNTTTPVDNLVVDENSEIIFELIRGQAVLAADNNPNITDLIEGQSITISKAQELARIIKIAGNHG